MYGLVSVHLMAAFCMFKRDIYAMLLIMYHERVSVLIMYELIYNHESSFIIWMISIGLLLPNDYHFFKYFFLKSKSRV